MNKLKYFGKIGLYAFHSLRIHATFWKGVAKTKTLERRLSQSLEDPQLGDEGLKFHVDSLIYVLLTGSVQ